MRIYGIGSEIVECLRVAQMIERHGELFIGRVYTPHEIEYCSRRREATQNYAGRWAAKQAVLKALGTAWSQGIHWRDVEVRNDKTGATKIALAGVARARCLEADITDLQISISQCRSHATAFAIAVCDDA